MKLRVLKPTVIDGGGIIMTEIPVEDIVAENQAIMAIDGSTSNSGIAILRALDGALMYTLSASRDSKGETPVHYKVRLKQAVKSIIEKNRNITHIYYEEPIIANVTSVANLFMLRTFIEELIIENEPNFDYIQHYEINNMRWKREFLAPEKVPQGTEKQKLAVRTKLETYLPFLNKVSQDEIDATCMGFVAANFIINNKSAEALESKKKPRPFKYNAVFIGANSDDDMLMDLYDVYTGPKQLLENGIGFTEIQGKTNFEKHIYEQMGEDDKVLVIKFSSKHHGNIVLQYKVGHLAAQFQYMYAVIWRVSRK